MSGGCDSEINERLAVNFAGSIILNGQDYLGDTENAWSGRAGFIYKFGEIKKPTLISQIEKKKIQEDLFKLSRMNKEMQEKTMF